MSVSPYCATCWSRKQRPSAKLCDDCTAQCVRKSAAARRRQSQAQTLDDVRRRKAQEAAAYRSRTSVLGPD
jgi:hypothetical protein